MALILSVRKGDKIAVGESMITVGNVYGEGAVDVFVDDEKYEIDDTKMTTVCPNVEVAAGFLSNTISHIRLIIKAPREIPIVRQ